MISKKLFVFGLIIAGFSFRLSAQSIFPRVPLMLNLDYARFKYDDQSCYLEIYYGFHPKQLTYRFVEGEYQGGVKISTKIIKLGTEDFVVNEESPLEISEGDTSDVWYRFPFVSQGGYAVPNGEYTMKVVASDLIEPSRRDSLTLDLVITPYGSDLALSDVELCKNITSSDQKDNLYYKNTLEVIPFPSLVFGSSTIPVVFYYTELYNVSPGVTYNVKVEILNRQGASVREVSKQRVFNFDSSIDVGTIPVAAYPSGKYTFRLALQDENQNLLAKSDKTFFIFNPHVQVAQQPLMQDKAIFQGMTSEELSNEFEFARYMATNDEKKLFKELETVEGKREFLFEFWTKVAKGRRDIPPVGRDEYLQRTRIADERYSSFGKKGWETDRGMVLMKYGLPDEIERFPSEADTKPYEVWNYFSIENGVQFYFVMRYGYGQYELVHSTKRGEVQDVNWMEYLR